MNVIVNIFFLRGEKVMGDDEAEVRGVFRSAG